MRIAGRRNRALVGLHGAAVGILLASILAVVVESRSSADTALVHTTGLDAPIGGAVAAVESVVDTVEAAAPAPVGDVAEAVSSTLEPLPDGSESGSGVLPLPFQLPPPIGSRPAPAPTTSTSTTTTSTTVASSPPPVDTAPGTVIQSVPAGRVGTIHVIGELTGPGRVEIRVGGRYVGGYSAGSLPRSIEAVAHAAAPTDLVEVAAADGDPQVRNLVVTEAEPVLTTSADRLVDPAGRTVVLKGANHSGPFSAYYANSGDYLPTTMAGMAAWGMSSVRIQINQNYWDDCRIFNRVSPEYRQFVDTMIRSANAAGLVAVLDLHTSGNGTGRCEERPALYPMADERSKAFWYSVAGAYKDNPLVVLDLYNEPHDISESTWRDGDGRWVGMQSLYNIVRNAGYTGPVIVSGTGWAFDTTVLNRMPLDGYGIMAGLHIFGTDSTEAKSDQYRPRTFDAGYRDQMAWMIRSVADRYPTVVTEFGTPYWYDGQFNAGVVQFLESQGVSWMVYAWGEKTSETPSHYDNFGILRTKQTENPLPNPGGQPIVDALADDRSAGAPRSVTGNL